MLLHGDADLAGIAVPHHIRKGFLEDADQAVLDFPGDLTSHIIPQQDRTEGEAVGQASDRLLQVYGLIVQVMYTAADAVHGRIQGNIQVVQYRAKLCLPVYGPGRAQQQDGTGENVPYAVMDLPGDPVPLPQGGGVDLIVLLFQKRFILFRQQKMILPAVVLALPEQHIQPLILPGMALQKRGQQKTEDAHPQRKHQGIYGMGHMIQEQKAGAGQHQPPAFRQEQIKQSRKKTEKRRK